MLELKKSGTERKTQHNKKLNEKKKEIKKKSRFVGGVINSTFIVRL